MVLLVLVEPIDARAVFNASEIFFGEAAVVGVAGDAEVPGAIFGLVGEIAFLGELLDESDHLGDVIGGAGAGMLKGALDAEGVEIFEEGRCTWRCSLQWTTRFGGVADDLVVDVGDVHDVVDAETGEQEGAAEDVDVEEGAEVADVAVEVVDGGAGQA